MRKYGGMETSDIKKMKDLESENSLLKQMQELFSLALAHWAEEHGVRLEFIRPGKLTQNTFIKRFNRTEILDFTCS